MIIIVGLGNPGKKFEKTRHNVGFRAVTAFQAKDGFSDFKFSKKFKAEISEGILDSKKIVLAKPQTFMNDSGEAVRRIIENWKLEIGNLFVVHDDIDLPLGKIKISAGRSSAGHKGVESIIKKLGTKNFARFRIGIKLEKTENRKQKIEDFVLKKFTTDEEKSLKEVIEKTAEAIEMVIKESVEKAMAKYN